MEKNAEPMIGIIQWISALTPQPNYANKYVSEQYTNQKGLEVELYPEQKDRNHANAHASWR
jgi:hypothetical protein